MNNYFSCEYKSGKPGAVGNHPRYLDFDQVRARLAEMNIERNALLAAYFKRQVEAKRWSGAIWAKAIVDAGRISEIVAGGGLYLLRSGYG